MSIASKECRETLYWINLFKRTDYLNNPEYKDNCEELVRILTSIVKSTQESLGE
jgi:four helix bundle protein